MKILVTGANGYLGQGIVRCLLDHGQEVIATDLSVVNVDIRAQQMEADLFTISDPFHYFGEPDVLLHLSWRDGFVHYSDAHILDLPKHYTFLKSMFENGIKQVAVMGSMHEIGFYEGSICENTPCHPTTPYGISKNALRQLTMMLGSKHSIPVQWLRGFYIVGNSQYGNSVFSKIVASVNNGRNEFPFTTGQNQFDFLDYNLFCEYVAATVQQANINGIINICSGKPEKLADRVESFIKENHYPITLKYGAFPDRSYDSKAVWGNADKIQKIMAIRVGQTENI